MTFDPTTTALGGERTTAVNPGDERTRVVHPGGEPTAVVNPGGYPGATPGAAPETSFYAGPDAEAVTQPIAVPGAPRGGRGGHRADRRPPRGTLLIAVVLGIGVSVGLGVYGRFHEASFVAINVAGFSSGLAVKAWLASLAFVFALVQLVSALRMYGKLGKAATGRAAGFVHRWSGRVAVLVTVPVAVHCLYALGFQDTDARVLAHSLLGCFFYGAFAAKMLLLGRDGAPRWALPVFGGLVFTGLTAIWLTSSLWFFGTSGLTF